jgi:PAS domain S-box-containing protein
MDSSSPSIPWKILVIDDDRDDYLIIKDVLAGSSPERYVLEWAGTFETGQRMLRSTQYDAIILDYSLGEKSGIDLLKALDAPTFDFPFILVSGYGSPEVFMEAMEAGAAYTLTKNELNGSILERGIQFAVKLKREEVALRKSNQALEASSKALIAQEAFSQENRQRTVDILASIEDGLFGLDREWRFTYVNPRAARNVGYTPDQLTGRNIWEAFPAVLGTEHERIYRKVMEERRPADFDFHGVLTGQFYNIRVFPSAEGITVFWVDITEKVQAREQMEQELAERERVKAALLESDEKFRAAFDNAAIGMAITTPDGRFVDANPAYCTITGYPKDELLQLRFTQIVHPDDFEKNMAVTNQMLRGEIVDFVVENRYVRKDGQAVWVRKSVSPVRIMGGATRWIVTLVEDITEGKRAEAAQREAEHALRENEAHLRQQNAILKGINRIFQQGISTESESELGNFCLKVVEETTQSKFGFLGEINQETGRLDNIAISDPGWDACRISDGRQSGSVPGGFVIHGIYGRVMLDGKSFFTNHPADHPDSIGTPAGHPPLTAFLGVPLYYGGEVIGMIGLGNRPGGYNAETLEAVEAFAPAIVQVFMIRRAEEGRQTSEANLRLQTRLIELSYEPVMVWDLEGGIISWNEGCERLYGFTRGEAVGQISHNLLRTVFPIPNEAFLEHLRTAGHWSGELLHQTKTGQTLFVESRHELLEMEGRRLVLETNRDITERKRAEEAQREAEQALRRSNEELFNERNRLLAVMEALPVGLAIYDEQGGVIQANAAFEEVWGSPRPQAGSVEEYDAYKAWWAETGKPVLPEEWAAAAAVQHGKTSKGQFIEIQRFDGRRGFVVNSGAPVRDGEGRLIGATVAIMDITERVRAEQALRQSEERFRVALSAMPMTVYIMDSDLRYTWIYNTWAGWDEEQILGRQDDELTGWEIPRELSVLKQTVLETGQTFRQEIMARVNGETKIYLISLEPFRDFNGKITGLIGASLDITEQRRAEMERHDAQVQSEIQRRLLENREQERQEIARDLHDGPVQLLSAIMFQLQVAREIEQDATLKLELDQAALNVKATVRDLREMMNELRPPAIIRFGLTKSIRIHLEDFREKHPEIHVTQHLFDDGNLLPEQVRLALFRVYQESLNNIVKHAGASSVSVRLSHKDNRVRLQIHDNGRGFDLHESLVQYTQHGHYGLAGMKERAEAVGGVFDVTSEKGKGTTISVMVDL